MNQSAQVRNGRSSGVTSGIAALLAALLLLLSLGAVSPDLHHKIHGNQDQNQGQEHSCVIALIKDGKIDFSFNLDFAVDQVRPFEFLEFGQQDGTPSYVRPRMLPWASGPPLIS